jgi:hypothetical protein
MRFLAFLEGTSGVRGFLVGNEEGDSLYSYGTGGQQGWSAVRAAAIARDFGVAGAIAGLGSFSSAAVRSTQSSRLLAQGRESVAVIDLELTRATGDLETQLQATEWSSTAEDDTVGPSSGGSEHETLPPRASGSDAKPIAPRAPVVVSHASASAPVSPAAPPVPARPFQGIHAIAGRAVPRPNAPLTAAPRSAAAAVAAPAALAPARTARPPLPPARSSASASPVDDAAEAARSGAPAAAPGEPPSTRRDEPTSAASALLTGSLATFALPDLLEFLRVGQRTGTLVCTSDAGLGAIHLKRGRITGAASPGVPSIGDWLVQRGAISQDKLHEALRHHTQSGAKTQLGASLVSQKLVSHDTLHEALVFHVGAVLRKLMTWESGAFTFDPAVADASALAHDIEIEPQAVLLNIFKEMDDSQRA